MAIIRPESMDFSKQTFSAIIYGSPGVGKTTLALSAPNPVLIDFDDGVSRVRASHRAPTIVCNTYEEVLTDIDSPEMKEFETIIIDTGGSFVTFLKDWAFRNKADAKTKAGQFNSLKGFGYVKSEFAAFTDKIKTVLKSYSLTSTYIDGYGSVDYSVITGDIGEAPATLKLGDRELKNYTEGPDVKELQETLISMGYDCGSFGADGEYGDCTEMAVRAFQKDTGVKVNGKYDADTHKALTAVLDKQKSETEPEKAQYVQIQKNRKCYVRTAPSTDGKALGVAHSEDKLPYQGQTSENGWLLVSYTPKGETIPTNAWVSGKYGKLVS